MFLKSHNEIKQKYFLVAGTFTLRLFRKKVHQGTKEKKKLPELNIEIQNHAGYG